MPRKFPAPLCEKSAFMNSGSSAAACFPPSDSSRLGNGTIPRVRFLLVERVATHVAGVADSCMRRACTAC